MTHRMPQSGEEWKHYKGTVYWIVGTAYDESGFLAVVYKDLKAENLYVQSLYRFLQTIEVDDWKEGDSVYGPRIMVHKPRFTFVRDKYTPGTL